MAEWNEVRERPTYME